MIQTIIGPLIGSFLAILSSLLLWFLKEIYDKRKLIENNKKEIDSIFFMATRDSEESMRDLGFVIPQMRNGIKKMKQIEDLNVFMSPKLNKVYINEERLAILKQGLGFITEQQVDIAISSSKKFNGYLEQFESSPAFIFDGILKLLNSNIINKEKAFSDYKNGMENFLNDFEKMMVKHLETAQRNMLRPIVVIKASKENLKRFNNTQNPETDNELNDLAAIVLDAVKKDME